VLSSSIRPVPKPTSCTFAGDVLYITTVGGAGPAGGMFAVRPGVSGPPATPWQPVATRS
jgi:sugar lactone lactonase YvrE